jgi:hypothetical protein
MAKRLSATEKSARIVPPKKKGSAKTRAAAMHQTMNTLPKASKSYNVTKLTRAK